MMAVLADDRTGPVICSQEGHGLRMSSFLKVTEGRSMRRRGTVTALRFVAQIDHARGLDADDSDVGRRSPGGAAVGAGEGMAATMAATLTAQDDRRVPAVVTTQRE